MAYRSFLEVLAGLITRLDTVCPEGTHNQWRKDPPGQLSIDPVADEQFGWVTGWAEAS
jgi:hypothetical protein